ncbi:MAG: hypothetical protein FVQ83_12920 [Chloroflexi bacterium]|nr:hypothetical protein [Chloroflexota bacterium]
MRDRKELRLRRNQQLARLFTWKNILISIPVMLVLAVGIYYIPPVHSRLAWRVADLRTRIIYALNPPEEALFLPGDLFLIESNVRATLTALAPPATPSPSPTTTGPLQTPAATSTPTITPPSLPSYVYLDGVNYEDQHGRWNYCGPANLSMSLTYWGWTGNRDVAGRYLKPGIPGNASYEDKNVMPYEMQDFVETQTDYSMLIRVGGELEVLKRLIAGGYPVIVEKGYYEFDHTGTYGWLGHYLFVTGYDEVEQHFIVQDTYLEPGADMQSPYDVFEDGWRSFNYLFMVVFPPVQEAEVLEQLGPWADEAWANRNAWQIANAETEIFSGINQFFAWFNTGASHVKLFEYVDAASAFDNAFLLYNNLTTDDTQRPYRIMWYRTGAYWAYYYSARYQTVIDLANTTLYETISAPTLEESLYWRGLAREALGDLEGAIEDYLETVRLNYNFTPGLDQLERLGIEP